MKTTSLVTLLAASAVGSAYGHASGHTIIETAEELDGFDTLVTAVELADLYEALDNKKSELTVFAPTDDAFASDDLAGVLPFLLMNNHYSRSLLADVLLYHVVPAELAQDSLGSEQSTLLSGASLSFSGDGSSINQGAAHVVVNDVEAKGGIIHAIDAVLVPPSLPLQTIADVANPKLLEALTAAGLASLFTEAHDTVYTVFAPTDAAWDAFYAATGTSFEEIASDMRLTKLFVRVLKSHVIANKAFDSTKVVNKRKLKTLSHKLKTKTQVLPFLETTDILTLNGIVHTVNSILETPCSRSFLRRLNKVRDNHN